MWGMDDPSYSLQNGVFQMTATRFVSILASITLAIGGCGGVANYQTITTISGRVIQTDKFGSQNDGGWIIGRTKDDRPFRIRESEVEIVVGTGAYQQESLGTD